MRVLLTADAVGGVWQYATELAAALAAHEVETVLAVVGPAPSAAQRAVAARLPRTILVETGLPLDWLCDGAAPVRAAADAIRRLAAAERVDLIQHNSPTLAAGGAGGVPTVAVTHGCVATWWRAARAGPLDPGYHWHRALMAEGLAAADAVVAPSASYAAAVAAEYALPALPRVVHNGRAPLTTVTEPHPAPRALAVGRLWDTVKNTALLDRAAALTAVPFAAAGAVAGPHGEQVALTHLAPLGVLDDAALAAELAWRPIFVSAVTFEPFGLAVLEAAQAGCPLLLSDIATFRELWDGAAAFLPPDDPAAWAAALDALAADPARREALGAAARTRATRYTPAATATAMLGLYRELLVARARPERVAA